MLWNIWTIPLIPSVADWSCNGIISTPPWTNTLCYVTLCGLLQWVWWLSYLTGFQLTPLTGAIRTHPSLPWTYMALFFWSPQPKAKHPSDPLRPEDLPSYVKTKLPSHRCASKRNAFCFKPLCFRVGIESWYSQWAFGLPEIWEVLKHTLIPLPPNSVSPKAHFMWEAMPYKYPTITGVLVLSKVQIPDSGGSCFEY